MAVNVHMAKRTAAMVMVKKMHQKELECQVLAFPSPLQNPNICHCTKTILFLEMLFYYKCPGKLSNNMINY